MVKFRQDLSKKRMERRDIFATDMTNWPKRTKLYTKVICIIFHKPKKAILLRKFFLGEILPPQNLRKICLLLGGNIFKKFRLDLIQTRNEREEYLHDGYNKWAEKNKVYVMS